MSSTVTPAAPRPALGRRAELVGAMLQIVSRDGLDRLSVREVATRAGVSIGAVQHHFATKDDMLVAAFLETVARTRRRVEAIELGAEVRANLVAVLSQLLPLDDERAADTRVHLAFAARAAVTPALAAIQHDTLAGIHVELAAAFAVTRPRSARGRATAAQAAQEALATVDGLALHAASAPGLLPPEVLVHLLEQTIDRLLV